MCQTPIVLKSLPVLEKHLKDYLGTERAEYFQDLLAESLHPSASFYRLEAEPDGQWEISWATKWLTARGGRMSKALLEKLEHGMNRGATFLARSFVYYAFSDTKDLVFTPDTVRMPVLERVVKAEEQFRGKLLAKIKKAGASIPGANLDYS